MKYQKYFEDSKKENAYLNSNSYEEPYVSLDDNGTVEYNASIKFTLSDGTVKKFHGTSVTSAMTSGLTSAITNVSLNKTVDTIRENVFQNCSALTTINLENVEKIEKNAFRNCANLDWISNDKNDKFYLLLPPDGHGIRKVVYYKVLSNVKQIGSRAFQNCSKIHEIICPKVRIIGHQAFEDCSGITEVELPEVRKIDYSAFNENKSLTSVTIPKIEFIGGAAFGVTKKLTDISIPNTLKSVGLQDKISAGEDTSNSSAPLFGKGALSGITYSGTVEEFEAIGDLGYWESSASTVTVKCTDGTKEIIKTNKNTGTTIGGIGGIGIGGNA